MAELDRRNFLKLVGAGAGAAATTSCYRYSDLPEQLIPYVVQPEEITPGIAVHYATTCQECGAGCGVHVRTREGRAVKVEGNPDHPINRGALCARGQAGIGRTYDPDRYRGPMRRGENGELEAIGWEDAIALLAQKIQGAGAAVRLFGSPVGPTLDGLLDAWVEAVGAGGRLVYEPFAYEVQREAARTVFGEDRRPIFDLTDSDYVIDFGADALDAGVSPAEHQRQLAEARDITKAAGRDARFVYVGPRMSVTAGAADVWLAAKPGTEGILALGIAKVAYEQRREQGLPVGGDVGQLSGILNRFGASQVSQRTGVAREEIERVGRGIAAAKRAVALPPGVALTSRRATAAVGAVLVLNAVVGAVGRNVSLAPPPASSPASFRDVTAFVDSVRGGRIAVLIVHGSNPVHTLPAALGFADALEKVPFVVSTASAPDETSAHADLILPDHTPLESWGDSAPRPGVRSMVQPAMRPLYDTQSLGDTLLATARAMGSAEELPTESFRQVVEQAWADTDWRAALGRGGVFGDARAAGASVVSSVATLEFKEPQLEGDGEHTLLAFPSPLLYDGRGANLPWLQETPDPVTKISWQSWVEVSRATAKSLGVEEGDVVAVETGSGRIEAPVYPRGGLRDDVVAVAIGQGHTVGRYASAEGAARGVNVLDLLPAVSDETGGRAWLTTRAKITATGAHQRLPNSQRTDNKRGRQLGEAITLAALDSGEWNAAARAPLHGGHGERDHAGGNHEPTVVGGAHGGGHGEEHGDDHAETPPVDAGGDTAGEHGGEHAGPHEILRPFDAAADAVDGSPYRWGMTIDVDRCTGCSACVVACAIENNVPNVGEEGVLRGRHMQWIRIERYNGDGEQELLTGRQRPEDREELGRIDVRHSPMLCQQCGAAPCEPVCPVLATYHNEEGMNGMIYNRCIGTRYCSNNCPYKVRRFNWFDYGIHNWPDPMPLMLNPDVTVRGQGVMEKCTFCIQRVQEARQEAHGDGQTIPDGAVTPACAQTCPSDAISFGNLRDEKSDVVTRAETNENRAYHALHVLNTRPGITYFARVKRNDDGGHPG